MRRALARARGDGCLLAYCSILETWLGPLGSVDHLRATPPIASRRQLILTVARIGTDRAATQHADAENLPGTNPRIARGDKPLTVVLLAFPHLAFTAPSPTESCDRSRATREFLPDSDGPPTQTPAIRGFRDCTPDASFRQRGLNRPGKSTRPRPSRPSKAPARRMSADPRGTMSLAQRVAWSKSRQLGG